MGVIRAGTAPGTPLGPRTHAPAADDRRPGHANDSSSSSNSSNSSNGKGGSPDGA
ncbi:hypothetical protein HNR23_005118 [Nocardiopsis mwathae]|uniref:Uncharacterized protein n=1 Tax=Nocardiopsis mwathae TaxID=1472723 RepID=A0A7W9YMS5_9ACTN|nr:hypothetical protein [Nocardiopsis mwathae]